LDGGADLGGAAHAVGDDDGAFGGEVLAEFGEALLAGFKLGAQGGGQKTNLECRMRNSVIRPQSAFVIPASHRVY
jgi:hypothetical protein